jgi:hypothetical protein
MTSNMVSSGRLLHGSEQVAGWMGDEIHML